MPALRRRSDRGLSLVDLTVVLAIAGIFTAVALPSYQSTLARGRRSEAIEALRQLQAAQESHRARTGRYAARADALQGLPPRGAHYEVALVAGHDRGYIARALALAGPREDGCSELTLAVLDGELTQGPSDRCWNR